MAHVVRLATDQCVGGVTARTMFVQVSREVLEQVAGGAIPFAYAMGLVSRDDGRLQLLVKLLAK